MKKQVNKAPVVRIITGIAAAVAVSGFAIVRKFLAEYSHGSQARPKNVIKYRAIMCSACNHNITLVIELTKVDIEVQLRILAISNETAEHFAAAKGLRCVAAFPGGGALPVRFSDVASETSIFDRSGIIRLAAEGLVSLEKTGAAMKAA